MREDDMMDFMPLGQDVSDIEIINEDHYSKGMTETVQPFMKSIRIKGRVSSRLPIYYELYPLENSKGTIVISHGFTEAAAKFEELIYYFLQAGYQCAAVDHRGHGRSFREIRNLSLVTIGSFDDYILDLHDVVHKVVMKKMDPDPETLYLYGHSMGGCIAARYAQVYPDDFKKVILSSPMLGIIYDGVPAIVANAMAMTMRMMGFGNKKVFAHSEFSAAPHFEAACSDSESRYLYYHKRRCVDKNLRTNAATYNWLVQASKGCRMVTSAANIDKIKAKVLLFSAENDTLVDAGAQKHFVSCAADAKGILVEGSKHEIYFGKNAIIARYLKAILDFLG